MQTMSAVIFRLIMPACGRSFAPRRTEGVMSVLRASRQRDVRATMRGTGLSALLAAFTLSIGRADSNAGQLSVGASVQPVATLNMLLTRREIQLSAQDIEHGVVDVPAAMQVEIRSNSSQGYVLNVQPRAAVFIRAQISGLDSVVEVGPEGGSVVQRWQRERVQRLSMGYRFYLMPGLAPGIYPWPVQLSVKPL